MDEEHDELPDDLPPPRPFRPWDAAGVDQPGVDQPGVAQPGVAQSRPAGVVPTSSDLMPQLARSRPAVPVVPRRQLAPPAAPIRTPVGVVGDRPMVGTILALAIAVCAWLPWISLSTTSLIGASGSSGATVQLDAWAIPASYLWSSTPSPGGVELGYLILAVAVAVLAASWTFAIPRRGVRLIGALGTGVPLLFLMQLQRALSRSTLVASQRGLTEVTGFGVYLMVVVGLVVVFVPPGPAR